MNIDEMQAGREMDALVGEKVMGFKPYDDYYAHGGVHGCISPKYSTSIASAFQVVDKLIELGWSVEIYQSRGGAQCNMRSIFHPGNLKKIISTGMEPSIAICRAALKVVEQEGG